MPVPASTEDEPAETASYHSDEEEDPDGGGGGAATAPEENIKSAEVHAALKDSNTTSTPDTESPVMISVDVSTKK